ncbi:MAG: PhoH family protein [Gammaproteobacteria bacterium]|jgi:PhoH-like ATPase|nr:PhoH family protein [Gammaproteobacteria bacterium]
MTQPKRLYVLDTNVLMHDPTALFRFEEHDIYIPMVVLEELDAAKKGLSEVARNVRQVSRYLSDLMPASKDAMSLAAGLSLQHPSSIDMPGTTGRLYFHSNTDASEEHLRHNGTLADNRILHAVIELRAQYKTHAVVLVSKDINLRIKARILNLPAEDYENDKVLDDLSLLYHGYKTVEESFWEQYLELESWTTDTGHTWYRCQRLPGDEWHPNQCLKIGTRNGLEAIVKDVNDKTFSFRVADDLRQESHAVWSIQARNTEQNFALNLLLDPDVDFITLMGTAGTGKTLLTLAAGLAQVMDMKRYSEIIMTRATVSVGDEIGYLPGTEEEKMNPWMGALHDNLEVLTNPQEGGDWARQATQDLINNKIKVRSMSFMRGRTFLNRYVIIDEAQNLTPKQMKTLLTRAGPGTKMICIGNVEQIDTPYLTETSSGLTFAVERFQHWDYSGHITLQRGERSRLADYASKVL